MKLMNNIYGIILILSFFLSAFPLQANEQKDSLSFYMEEATRNNPDLEAVFYDYKASVEKIAQAGAYNDPEISFNFLLQPMEQVMGKQIGDIELMQMFPWFGTKKAARTEAQEMSKMKFEAFREKKLLLDYEVESQWYTLLKLKEQVRYLHSQLELLRRIESMAIQKVTASPTASAASRLPAMANPVAAAPAVAEGMSGMNGVGGMGGMAPNKNSESMQSTGMANSGGALSDVLGIQIEILELENELETTLSEKKAAEANFNRLLNRDQGLAVQLPDTLSLKRQIWEDTDFDTLLLTRNPMLAMAKAEEQVALAKLEMDKKMGMPMFGVGVQYMINGKLDNDKMPMGKMPADPSMNGKDMLMPMIKISLPVFRNKYKARERENRYYIQMSQLKYQNTYNMLRASYFSLRQQMEDKDRKIKLYDRQIKLVYATLNLVTAEFTAGKADLTDIIQIERQLRELNFKKTESVSEYNILSAGVWKMIANNFNTEE
ncbi:MAG: TolC family protein [Bacteroidales bacterium]